jgi:hypothetical protein
MSILESNPRIAEFVLTEASGQRSRENITVTQGGTEILSGTILAKADNAATGTGTATAGNTGNPTFGTITAGVTAVPGTYTLTFTAATKFDVENPDGVKIGSGTTGVAFSKAGIGFTLTAGGTPAVAGDEWTIAVAAGTGKHIPYTADGAAGPAVGVLYNYLPAATGDVDAVGFVRDCEVLRGALTGLDAAGEAQLTDIGVIVRGTTGQLSTDD